jgi:hypothetical protein
LDGVDKNLPALGADNVLADTDNFDTIKRYFSQLNPRNETTGKVYTIIILAQSIPFKDVMHKALSSLRKQNIGLYPKASDHECTADVGLLLYLARQQDNECLAHLISHHIGELIGLKWKQVHMTEGFKKPDPANPQRKILALHVEGLADRAQDGCA